MVLVYLTAVGVTTSHKIAVHDLVMFTPVLLNTRIHRELSELKLTSARLNPVSAIGQ